jgi:hypothetical protein
VSSSLFTWINFFCSPLRHYFHRYLLYNSQRTPLLPSRSGPHQSKLSMTQVVMFRALMNLFFVQSQSTLGRRSANLLLVNNIILLPEISSSSKVFIPSKSLFLVVPSNTNFALLKT